MKKIILLLTIILSFSSYSQDNKVIIANNNDGMRLVVNGKDFMINGMNWDYFPIGTNYSYSLWNQSDDFIKIALEIEMGLLKNMGVNTIRVYSGMPKKWIEYIYDNFAAMVQHLY